MGLERENRKYWRGQIINEIMQENIPQTKHTSFRLKRRQTRGEETDRRIWTRSDIYAVATNTTRRDGRAGNQERCRWGGRTGVLQRQRGLPGTGMIWRKIWRWGGESSRVAGWEKCTPGKGEARMPAGRAGLARPPRERKGRGSWSRVTGVENEGRGQRAGGAPGRAGGHGEDLGPCPSLWGRA